MPSTGSLIPFHSHDNINILKALSENTSQQLLFHGKLIDAAVSQEENNFLERKNDGLYVDGSIIKDFAYKNGVLLFKDVTVSQEYDKRAVTAMVYELWEQYDEEQAVAEGGAAE